MKHESKLQAQASGKIFLDVLNGQRGARVPFWFMRQAGRYLPEYRELREKKGGFLAMAFDPDAACEITMQPIRRFGMDAAIIFSDILVIPHALGQKLEFLTGEGPKLEALGSAKEIAALEFDDEKLGPVYAALRKTRDQLAAENFMETALIGFAGAPWTVATYMIEGGSSRDFSKIKKFMREKPGDFQALIDVLVDSTSRYLVRQVEAGAEALQIFDSWAGALDDEEFRKYSIQPVKKIVANIRAKYPHVPVIGFPKGAGKNYVPFAKETGITAIGIDPDAGAAWASQHLQPLMPVQGNLNPRLVIEGGSMMKDAVNSILDALGKGPFIFNLGHGIDKETPVKNVEELVAQVKGFRL